MLSSSSMFPAILEAHVEDLVVRSVGNPRVGSLAPTQGGRISIRTAPCTRWGPFLRESESEPACAGNTLVWLLRVRGALPHDSPVTPL